MTLALASIRNRQARAQGSMAMVPAWVAAPAAAMLALVVYALTLAPDLYSLDSPELAAAAHQLGIAHAPGYPLYTLAGWLFSHAFPFGTVALRMNLLSAVFAAGTVAVVYLLCARLVSRPAAAASAALALAFSYYFWAMSLAAEVYTLDAALYAGTLLAAVAWRRDRTLALAAAAGLLLGLGMATRTTTLLAAPALIAFAWMSGERSPRAYGAAALGVAAGLAFYLYLPLRSAAGADVAPGTYALDGTLRPFDLATWGGFWDHVTAAQFRGDAFAYGPLGALGETGTFALQLAGAFLLIGLPLGIAGIARLWQRDRGVLLLIGGTAAPAAVFFINYGTLDKEFMFLPAYVAWAAFIAVGIEWAVDAAVASQPAWEHGLGIAVAALALPALLLIVNAPLVSLRGDHSVRNDSEAFLGRVAPGAIVYGSFTDVAPLQYLQSVEGQREDVRLVNSWTVDDAFLVALADANVGTTPLYVMDRERALATRYAFAPVGEPGNPAGYEVRALAR